MNEIQLFHSISTLGQSSLWAGFGIMSTFTIRFIIGSYQSIASDSRIYRYLTSMSSLLCAFIYLVLGLASYTPYTFPIDTFNFVNVRYILWFITTPMLLINVANLEKIEYPKIFLILTSNILVLSGGYIADIASDPVIIWPIFTFSTLNFVFIQYMFISHLYIIETNTQISSIDTKTVRVLIFYISIVWSVYPLLFLLKKTIDIQTDIEILAYLLLDILTKGLFGIILTGSRDIQENRITPFGRISMAFAQIEPVITSGTNAPNLPENINIQPIPGHTVKKTLDDITISHKRRASIYIHSTSARSLENSYSTGVVMPIQTIHKNTNILDLLESGPKSCFYVEPISEKTYESITVDD